MSVHAQVSTATCILWFAWLDVVFTRIDSGSVDIRPNITNIEPCKMHRNHSHNQDVRRVTPYPPQEVSDARRYQTRGEADRAQGRTWEAGKGEEDR